MDSHSKRSGEHSDGNAGGTGSGASRTAGRQSERSRRDVLKYGGGLAVAVSTAGCSGILGGSDDSSGGPADVTESFYQALLDGDVEKANSYVHSDSPEGEVSEQQAALFEGQEITIENTEVVEKSESNATVKVTISASGETQESEVELRKEDGEWKLWE